MGVETQIKDVTSSFIHEKFRNELTGEFDESKAQLFADELELRRKSLQQQVHDTRYSERILRDVLSHRDAIKNAHKKSTFGSGNVLKGMDVAILPQVHKIVQMIREGKPEEEICLAAEAFVRAYSPYEMPVRTDACFYIASADEPNSPSLFFANRIPKSPLGIPITKLGQ